MGKASERDLVGEEDTDWGIDKNKYEYGWDPYAIVSLRQKTWGVEEARSQVRRYLR